MDKEKLIKHHFWILLGLAVLLLPVVMGGVWMGVADATETERKAIEKKSSDLKAARPKGDNYVKELETEKARLEEQKGRVWQEAYEAQAGLIEWPSTLAHLNKLNVGDAVSDEDRNTFRKPSVYLPEYEALSELVKPTELSGGWQQTMRLTKWGEKNPSSEELWLALEDLCVQRELLKCVHAVNQLLAKFELKTGPEVDKELKESLKPEAGETAQRFVSPYWQLDVVTSKTAAGAGNQFAFRGKLRNISHRRLNIGRIDFMVWLNDPAEGGAKPVVLPIEGDFLHVYRTDDSSGDDRRREIEFKSKPVSAAAAQTKIFAVEQKLDARYVPVKRIEKISLGYNSHRTADQALQPGLVSIKAKKDAGDAAPPADPNAAPPPPGGAVPTGDRTPSGIDRLRYISVSEQVRRMPIGLVLIVDQAHVQDVLRAFANSRLRFQTTQFHVNRFRGALSSVAPTATGSAASSGEEPTSNLMEMALYGLASIYEKYQDKNKPAAGDAPKQ